MLLFQHLLCRCTADELPHDAVDEGEVLLYVLCRVPGTGNGYVPRTLLRTVLAEKVIAATAAGLHHSLQGNEGSWMSVCSKLRLLL